MAEASQPESGTYQETNPGLLRMNPQPIAKEKLSAPTCKRSPSLSQVNSIFLLLF